MTSLDNVWGGGSTGMESKQLSDDTILYQGDQCTPLLPVNLFKTISIFYIA